jgi:hypothetical protein
VGAFRLREWITRRLTRFLTQPIGHYEKHYRVDVDLLKRHIEKGDILLVEGEQRVSSVIKYLSHSSWSHAALYVGDELVRRGGALRDLAVEHFGDEAEHLVVEALMDGVVASPLVKYSEHNVRVCRPHRLRANHLREILDEGIASIGMRYDLRNILDLAWHLMFVSLLSYSRRRDALRFGSGYSGEVICTSLIGRLFHQVGFPVLPSVTFPDDEDASRRRSFSFRRRRAAHPGVFKRRDPTLLMPRDFDLSPYFEVVKFNVVREGRFDYERIEWAEPEDAQTPSISASTGMPEAKRADG